MAECFLYLIKHFWCGDFTKLSLLLSLMEESEQLLAARSEGSRQNGHCRLDTKVVEDFRRRLKYFFMNPCEKYRARGRIPWKLMIQILKIAIITIQVILWLNVNVWQRLAAVTWHLRNLLPPPISTQLISFGLSNEMMVTFKDENLMTFRNLFLKGYKDHQYGSSFIYTKRDVYEHINYIINKVLKTENASSFYIISLYNLI